MFGWLAARVSPDHHNTAQTIEEGTLVRRVEPGASTRQSDADPAHGQETMIEITSL